MSPLGLNVMEWLRKQSDVTLLRDDTDRDGDTITCCYGGAAYRISVRRGPSDLMIRKEHMRKECKW